MPPIHDQWKVWGGHWRHAAENIQDITARRIKIVSSPISPASCHGIDQVRLSIGSATKTADCYQSEWGDDNSILISLLAYRYQRLWLSDA